MGECGNINSLMQIKKDKKDKTQDKNKNFGWGMASTRPGQQGPTPPLDSQTSIATAGLWLCVARIDVYMSYATG